MPKSIAILAGLAVAALAIYLGFLFGAGGWRGPYICSLALPFVYPVVLIRLTAEEATDVAIDVVILFLAILADIYLYVNSAVTDHTYFLLILQSELPYTWFLLWVVWQLLVLVTIARGILHRRDERAREDA